jgi:putative phosphoribosyl transferase
VPWATHLFEEAGALEKVARLARDWFTRHLASAARPTADASDARTAGGADIAGIP